jgi:hypothetical protein
MEDTHAIDPSSSPVCTALQDTTRQNRAPGEILVQNGAPSSSQNSLSFQVKTTSALDPRLILWTHRSRDQPRSPQIGQLVIPAQHQVAS